MYLFCSGATGHGHRSNLAPQNMQWAIRSRDGARGAGVRLTGGSNLVFIDPSSLRRSTPNSTTVAASVEPVTMATTASCLGRAFGIVIRQIADLLTMIHDYQTTPPTHPYLEVGFQESINLQVACCKYF